MFRSPRIHPKRFHFSEPHRLQRYGLRALPQVTIFLLDMEHVVVLFWYTVVLKLWLFHSTVKWVARNERMFWHIRLSWNDHTTMTSWSTRTTRLISKEWSTTFSIPSHICDLWGFWDRYVERGGQSVFKDVWYGYTLLLISFTLIRLN